MGANIVSLSTVGSVGQFLSELFYKQHKNYACSYCACLLGKLPR
jgi:hypothetical protein